MNFSISNIAWDTQQDKQIYKLMQDLGFQYLEIAPTRIFPVKPYDELEKSVRWAEELKKVYKISIASMQSIWFGRNENMFNSFHERSLLIDYTKKAIEFASGLGCKNLVFGCPKNRIASDNVNTDAIAIPFFKAIGDYAYENGTAIALEANPVIYNTNYINDTYSAIELINKVNSPGFKLNLDLGAMITNNESEKVIVGNVSLINHVHISEPYLEPIKERLLHKNVASILAAENYNACISIEMRNGANITQITQIMQYVKNIFS